MANRKNTPEQVAARFWSKVAKFEGDECWLYTGQPHKDGYGEFYINDARGKVLAHRFSWELTFGSPGKWFVLHTCDNPACVNPNHLDLGTQQDNMADKMSKGRHPRGTVVYNAKLTEDDVREIRSSTLKGVELAELFGISQKTVSFVRHYKNYINVE